MSEFKAGDHIEAVKEIRLASGFVIEAGSRGKVIGVSNLMGTVSVQFENYIGGVSVWASLIAPAAASGDGVETWGVHPTQRELEAYGDGYAAGLLDGPEYAPLMNEIAALKAQLAASERSREAAVETLVECTTLMNDHGNDDNWETVTMAYAEAIKRGREVAAQQAAGAE